MGKGGGGGISAGEMMSMQRTLQRESFEMQQQATLEAEERDKLRREEERLAELERRRAAAAEQAKQESDEEARETLLMGEAEALQEAEETGTLDRGLNLEGVQIERPDYEALDERPE